MTDREDADTVSAIDALVEEEHRLRAHGSAISDDDRARLAEIEQRLDQCWDRLRRRRAARDYDTDPGEASPRQVHDYLQ